MQYIPDLHNLGEDEQKGSKRETIFTTKLEPIFGKRKTDENDFRYIYNMKITGVEKGIV